MIGANGGIQGYNMFAYCNNNPVMGYDPSGLLSYHYHSLYMQCPIKYDYSNDLLTLYFDMNELIGESNSNLIILEPTYIELYYKFCKSSNYENHIERNEQRMLEEVLKDAEEAEAKNNLEVLDIVVGGAALVYGNQLKDDNEALNMIIDKVDEAWNTTVPIEDAKSFFHKSAVISEAIGTGLDIYSHTTKKPKRKVIAKALSRGFIATGIYFEIISTWM